MKWFFLAAVNEINVINLENFLPNYILLDSLLQQHHLTSLAPAFTKLQLGNIPKSKTALITLINTQQSDSLIKLTTRFQSPRINDKQCCEKSPLVWTSLPIKTGVLITFKFFSISYETRPLKLSKSSFIIITCICIKHLPIHLFLRIEVTNKHS